MYPPPALNGLNTSPGLPGTGFATGNCVALANFCEGEDFAGGLFAATREGAFVEGCFDVREATRGWGVAEGTATGRPGFVTSEAFAGAVGSSLLRTYRSGAVRVRPMSWAVSQPTRQIAIIAFAQWNKFIAALYRSPFISATYRQPADQFPRQSSPTSTSADKHRAQ